MKVTDGVMARMKALKINSVPSSWIVTTKDASVLTLSLRNVALLSVYQQVSAN